TSRRQFARLRQAGPFFYIVLSGLTVLLVTWSRHRNSLNQDGVVSFPASCLPFATLNFLCDIFPYVSCTRRSAHYQQPIATVASSIFCQLNYCVPDQPAD